MKKTYLFLILFGLSILSVSIYYYIRQSKQYDLIPPKMGPINEAIYGLGTVKSEHQFSFKIAVPKTIQEIYVSEGDVVTKNQKILKFNDDITIVSPFAGTVSNLPFHAGENVFTDRPVVEIEDTHQLYIEAVLDQESSMRVKKSNQVRLSFETIENKYFTGEVATLYHSNGEFIVRIQVPPLPSEILPGMTADVAIQIAEKESALLIPVRSVIMGVVLIERDRQRIKVPVKLGIMDQEWVEVTSDNIKPTDLVLIKKGL